MMVNCELTHLKMGWSILRLAAKLRILRWASDNLKIGKASSLAPTHIYIDITLFFNIKQKVCTKNKRISAVLVYIEIIR